MMADSAEAGAPEEPFARFQNDQAGVITSRPSSSSNNRGLSSEMNWQAEFLWITRKSSGLLLTLLTLFSKARNYGEQFSFDYTPRLSGGTLPAGELVRRLAGPSPGRTLLFQIPGRRCGPFAQREDSLRQQPGESEVFPCGQCPNGRCCSMPERAMPTIRSRRWPSLRSRPSGSAIP